MILSQKIRIYPNNKQKTFIEKSFGVARFTYNWILEQYNKESNHFDVYKLKKQFNALKKSDFPFVYEVSKYVSQEPFMDFKDSLRSVHSYKKEKKNELHFKSKRDTFQSFYIGGDQIKVITNEDNNKPYLKLPKMHPLKLNEHIRFKGLIVSCRVSRKFDKYYVSINVDVTDYKKENINIDSIGIDLGIKNNITLSNGLIINYPINIERQLKKIKMAQKKLSRKVHPRTKDEPKIFSKNYLKQKRRVDICLEKLDNIKRDFEHKLTYILTSTYAYIAIEDLSISKMKENKGIAKRLQKLGLYRFRKELEYKSQLYGSEIIIADRYYASSKICSICGNVKKTLTLNDRTYKCLKCGNVIDRDLNAAINLNNLVGRVTSELTPFDLDALTKKFIASKIKALKVEEGKQQKVCL